MNSIERARVLHWHRFRSREFGPETVGALGWRASESQTSRFEAVLRVGELKGRSVLDAGCGFGDLRGYLDARHIHCDYTGIDQMPEFLSQATMLYGNLPDTKFLLGDFARDRLPSADYVLASGALGYRSTEEGFHLRVIRKLFETATIALACNLLDASIFPKHDLLVGHDR